MNYKQRIREFVISDFLFGNPGTLRDETSFLESGIIDSTGILELISFVESSFGIKIEPDEVIPENFDSINRIGAFVDKKLPANGVIAK